MEPTISTAGRKKTAVKRVTGKSEAKFTKASSVEANASEDAAIPSRPKGKFPARDDFSEDETEETTTKQISTR